MKAFLKNICLRPSCYACEFKGLNRHSDITLADFWGVQSVLPDMDDDKGTSLILVCSESGKKYFNKIKRDMKHHEVDINVAVKHNSAAIKSVNYNPKRDCFMKDKESLPFDKLVQKYCSDKLTNKVMGKIKAVLRQVNSAR